MQIFDNHTFDNAQTQRIALLKVVWQTRAVILYTNFVADLFSERTIFTLPRSIVIKTMFQRVLDQFIDRNRQRRRGLGRQAHVRPLRPES